MKDEDAALAALRTFDGHVRARDVAAVMDGTTAEEAAANGRSAEVAMLLRRLVSAGKVDRDYGPSSCVYAIKD